MSAAAGAPAWSPSLQKALTWASGCAALRGGDRLITSRELFVGLLLAHPDPQGEVWRFLDYFGLTARDLLPDDYPVIDGAVLDAAAAAARTPEPRDFDDETASILDTAGSRAGGRAQVLHVLAELLSRPAWQEQLQVGLTRLGISAAELVRAFNDVVPWLERPGPDQADDAGVVDLSSSAPAGQQIGNWLSQQFPRKPAMLASFSNDIPDPKADFIGVSEEADAFAYLIASRTLVPPLAIGLFGDWGSGKSFLMSKIQQRVGQLTSLAAQDGGSGSKEIWTKVLPIEFNAWQYVETDLWAALLSRIFNKLSPQARLKLTELDRRQQEQRALLDENLHEQMAAEEAVAQFLKDEQEQRRDAEKAAELLERINEQVSSLQDAAMRTALEVHARSAAMTVLVGGADTLLEKKASDTIEEAAKTVEQARRLRVAAEAPVWRQKKFWTPRRVVWAGLALIIFPVVLAVLDHWGFNTPAALTAALGAVTAVLLTLLRGAVAFAEGQQKAALDAAAKVEQDLSGLVREAEKNLAAKQKKVDDTRNQIRDKRQEAAKAAARRGDIDRMGVRLNAGTVYADFLSGRYTSDDYRKRLGIVTTVSDDLEKLSSLIAEYNDSPVAQEPDGPPNRIVLYIDDLDRCPPARVVEVLEAVHLLLGFPLFVVVVAVDTRWLKAALSRALPILQERADPGTPAPTATDYLEKIFQIPFWVERLDEAGRHRLLRGLLLPSVARSNGSPPSPVSSNSVLAVGPREQQAAQAMLAAHGPWLDLDAQQFSITTAELAFIEALNPLVDGTPRQVKRFVNVCKLLLAMSPPLAGGEGLATERTAACFMAALHQSMPEFATKLAAAAASSTPGATLTTVLSALPDPETGVQRVRDWLAGRPPVLPLETAPFGFAHAPMLVKRWDVIQRLRFAEDGPTGPGPSR